MTSKIKIKIGPIEVECEGTENFLKKELLDILTTISTLYKQGDLPTGPPPSDGDEGSDEGIPATTGSIAVKLGCKSGTDLAEAAAAQLSLVSKHKHFSRQQLLKEMRAATAYFKRSYANNIDKSIRKLLKDDKFNEPSKGNFALSATFKGSLRARLAK